METNLPALQLAFPWDWNKVLTGTMRESLARMLGVAIVSRRWYGSKTRTIRHLEILDAVPIVEHARILVLKLSFTVGSDEIYQVPLAYAAQDNPRSSAATHWFEVQTNSGQSCGLVYDALGDPQVCQQVLKLFESPASYSGSHGQLVVHRTEAFAATRGDAAQPLAAKLVHAEQSNTSVIYGERMILKFFRRVETGLNPDFEISDFLTRQGFAHTPALAGAIEYQQDGDPWGLAMLQAFVPNQGDAWQFTLGWLADSMPQFRGATSADAVPELPAGTLLQATDDPVPVGARKAFGTLLSRVALLGQRTAEMHLKLASDRDDPDFAPQAFNETDRRLFYGRASQQARETFALLRERSTNLAGEIGDAARNVLQLETVALEHYERLANEQIEVDKIRIHGDYHLGQVLATADDFTIIDFEGEPVRSIADRRQKQLALRDVAGMIRSLHYASCTAAAEAPKQDSNSQAVQAWTKGWYAWSCVAFLSSYRHTAGAPSFLPGSLEEFETLLEGCLLEKAVYELRYELNNRPDWVYLPLAALADLLTAGA